MAGKAPFQGRSDQEKLLAHQSAPFPLIAELRPDVPRELLAVLKKLVEKDPSRRQASAAEVIRELQPFCRSEARLLDLLEKKSYLRIFLQFLH